MLSGEFPQNNQAISHYRMEVGVVVVVVEVVMTNNCICSN